jgi:hypothetical protein
MKPSWLLCKAGQVCFAAQLAASAFQCQCSGLVVCAHHATNFQTQRSSNTQGRHPAGPCKSCAVSQQAAGLVLLYFRGPSPPRAGITAQRSNELLQTIWLDKVHMHA